MRTVIVEDASRFARDLVTQELGILALIGRGVFAMSSTRRKARLVGKLKAPGIASERRARRSRAGSLMLSYGLTWLLWPSGCTGLRPKTGKRRSMREIAAELAQVGHLNERGKPYAAQSIKMMLEA